MTFQMIKWQITLKWCHYGIGISYLIAAISHSLRNYWGNVHGSMRDQSISMKTWATFQYPIRRLTVRSHKVSKPQDLYLELSDRSEICQALRQQGCRSACQISKRCDNLNYQSPGFETSRDLTIWRLIGYWNGALAFVGDMNFCPSKSDTLRLFVILVT